jgi:hypothetical protein
MVNVMTCDREVLWATSQREYFGIAINLYLLIKLEIFIISSQIVSLLIECDNVKCIFQDNRRSLVCFISLSDYILGIFIQLKKIDSLNAK